jgi:hypothetical protein
MAGPMSMPNVPRNTVSAPAAGRSSRSTSRGIIASSDGRCKAKRPAWAPASANTAHNNGSGSSAFRSSSADNTANATSVRSTTVRRSSASAMAPPTSDSTSTGINSANPSNPTSNGECVSW